MEKLRFSGCSYITMNVVLSTSIKNSWVFSLFEEEVKWQFLQLGKFISSSCKENVKELSLQSKCKYVKSTVATWIAHKSYEAFLPLGLLKKKYILKLIN